MTPGADVAAQDVPPTNGRGALIITRVRSSSAFLAIAGFFGAKGASGLAIITASANWLPVDDFADFTQFSLFLAYLTLVASGGVINGVIRQMSAHEEAAERRRVLHAATLIWAVASLLSMAAALAFARSLSELLTGSPRFAMLVVMLTASSSVAGLGQILCGALTGMKRTLLSILYQAIGLLAGVAACLVGLYRSDVAIAILGLSAGPMLTTLLGLVLLAPRLFSRSHWTAVVREAGVQLRFAGAFLVTASVPPIILFALRYVYRDAFGVAPIAYWLLANRVSDINTQIVGLYLGQIFLPTLTGTTVPAQRRVIARALGLCVGTSLLALVTFLAIGEPLMGLVLHDQLAGSHRYIAGYLFGDTLRAIVSVAMICALARNRPQIYALIEVIAYALFALAFVLLVRLGEESAPFIAYPAAYAVAGLIAWGLFIPDMRPRLRGRAAQSAREDEPTPS